ncbi:hypothetical protein BH09PAT1_BH09PAT1_1880 [soil metagenome]
MTMALKHGGTKKKAKSVLKRTMKGTLKHIKRKRKAEKK